MAGSEWLEKKFVEKLLTEQLTDDDVRNKAADAEDASFC